MFYFLKNIHPWELSKKSRIQKNMFESMMFLFPKMKNDLQFFVVWQLG